MNPETEAELQRTLGRMESKLDIVVDGNRDHEKRIKSLEGSRSRLLGAAGLVSASIAIAVEWFRGSHG